MMTKPKVLVVCRMGLNRSKYLSSYLKEKGYQTRFGGIGFKKKARRNEKINNPFNQKDVDWADIIVVVRKKYKPILREKYKIKDKKVIFLNVTDLRRIIGKNLDFKTFDKIWTYPQLRKAIKPYLPLNKK